MKICQKEAAKDIHRENTLSNKSQALTLHKKQSFSLWISLVNVTKSGENSGFGHIY